MAGTFDPYPGHSVNPYQPKTGKGSSSSKDKKVFQPTPGIKPYPITSVVSQNVQRLVRLFITSSINYKMIHRCYNYVYKRESFPF